VRLAGQAALTSIGACHYFAAPSHASLTLHTTLNGSVYHIDASLPAARRIVPLTCAHAPLASVLAMPPRVLYDHGQFAETYDLLLI
jgi:hypothetical protein